MAAISDNARGALLMTVAMAAFTINDTFMKAASDELALFQTIFLRGVGASLLLIVIAGLMGQIDLTMSRRDWLLVAIRSACEAAAAILFIGALFQMPLPNVTAILQALPLAITLAGAIFLGEPVGWRRLVAIVIGFVGVMLIIRPGPDGFNSYSLLALGSVAAVTIRDLVMRRVSAQVPSLTVALITAVTVMVVAGAGCLVTDWKPVTTTAALQVAGSSSFLIFGYVTSVTVMRVGDIGFVAPFRYTSLLWALVLGLAVFGQWPTALTLLGAAIVIATGLFTLYRERAVGQRDLVAKAEPADL